MEDAAVSSYIRLTKVHFHASVEQLQVREGRRNAALLFLVPGLFLDHDIHEIAHIIGIVMIAVFHQHLLHHVHCAVHDLHHLGLLLAKRRQIGEPGKGVQRAVGCRSAFRQDNIHLKKIQD